MVSEQAVLAALRAIKDPDSQQDIVSLGLVRDLAISDTEVAFTLAFTSQPPAVKVSMHSAASRIVREMPGVERVQVKMGSGAQPRGAPAAAPQAHAHGGAQAHGHGAPQAPAADLIPDVKHTIAVSSGKGGVGKSTVAVNLAVALRGMAAGVGIIDADVYGPDIPMMLGSRGKPGMFDNRIIPVEAHGLKMMSIGLL